MEPENQTHAASKRQPRRRTAKFVIAPIVLLVLLVAAGLIGWFSHGQTAYSDKSINKNEYQALFLTNGQVYFGKLSDLGQKYVSMDDIYYLQVQQASSDQQNVQPAGNSSTPNSQVSLAKLGNELHGPEDHMFVASDQVLFWENMKNDSKVTQAIEKFQNQ